jgi:hypothetical protein
MVSQLRAGNDAVKAQLNFSDVNEAIKGCDNELSRAATDKVSANHERWEI